MMVPVIKLPAYKVSSQNTAYKVIFFGKNPRPYIRDALYILVLHLWRRAALPVAVSERPEGAVAASHHNAIVTEKN